MQDDLMWGLVVIGLILCALLGIVIKKQLTNIRQLRSSRELSEPLKNESQLGIKQSLLVLAGSVVEGQIEVSEACMRIKILLDHYDPELQKEYPFDVFNKVYERLENMPRFAQRKAVDKRVLAKLDQTRYRVEREFEAEVMTATRALIQRLDPPLH